MMLTVLCVGLEYLDIEQVGERYDRRLTTGRALVNWCFAIGNCFGVGSTTWISALPALGLWQQGVYLIDNRIAFDPEADCSVTEDQAE